MGVLSLTSWERRALVEQLRATADARIYRRTLALLEVAQGRPVVEVAGELHVGRRSLQRWLASFRQTRDPQAMADRPGRGRPRLFSDEDLAFLNRCLRAAPASWGYTARGWTVPLLQEHLASCGRPSCSADTLRRYLDAQDWAWKRPRYVLEPDPEKEKKTPHPNAAGASGPAYPGAF